MSARFPLVRLGAVLLLVSLASAAHARGSVDPDDPADPADPATAAPPAAAPAPEPASVDQPALVAPAAAPAFAPARALVRVPDAAKPAHVPLAKRWWFWTSLGGAAVAVVLLGLYLTPPKPYSGNASPGLEQVF